MTFQEKLRRLAPTINKSRAARAVGLKENAISTYMARGSLPRVDIALKIAMALGVPLDWLADDRQDFPPPQADKSSVRDFGDADLVHDLARRYRGAQLDFLNEADRVKQFDWQRAADAAEAMQQNDSTPELVRQAMFLLGSAQVKFKRIAADLDVERYCIVHHEQLPGGSRPIGEFEMVSRGEEWFRLTEIPGLKRFAGAVGQSPEWLNSPLKKLDDEYQARTAQYAQVLADRSRAESERLGLQSTKRRRKTAG